MSLSKHSLEGMPGEILLNILGNFEAIPKDDARYGFSLSELDPKRGLISLSLCSKHLHQVGEPLKMSVFRIFE